MRKARKARTKRSARKVAVMESRTTSLQDLPRMVTQIRLAGIHQLQSAVVYYQHQLDREWKAVRKALLDGAPVERGPIRAFIKQTNNGKQLVVK